MGPIEKLHHRLSIINTVPQFNIQLKQIDNSILKEAHDRFRLPELRESAKLLKGIEVNGASPFLKQYQNQSSEIEQAMKKMRSPWLDTHEIARSLGGFAELQRIGHALGNLPTFDDRLTDALRVDLGDWRSSITWPEKIFTDPAMRTAFYTKRGFDPALTKFPDNAFQESVNLAGLKETPTLIDTYNYENNEQDKEKEPAYTRTNVAHDRLQRFETQVRDFIDTTMTDAIGDNWIKQRVPGELRKSWLKKQQKTRDNGEREYPLLAYADFTDYVPIIIRKDNWESVFKPIFRRKDSVQESFQRLYPIRICTMHARMITQDDELYMYVEIKRILKAISTR